MDFSIRLTPESQQKVNKLAEAGKVDFRPALNVIGIGYRKEVKAIFERQQPRGEGMRWPRLSQRYAAWKAKRFPGAPLLVRTGLLKDSMTQQGANGNITVIGKAGAVFGTSISYGIYHDSDAPRSGRLPRRNFSEPSDRRAVIWVQQIRDAVVQAFKANGISVEGGLIA